MARRTKNALALLIVDMVDKDRNDSTFVSFVESMLDLTHQEITSEVPWAKWLLDEVSLTATVAGTQYIVMPSDLDIDSIISIRDETNNRRVIRITPQEADMIDPGRDLTGDEILWWYQRVETTSPGFEDRIYFINRPDSVDTLKAIFGTDPGSVSTAQTYQLPPKHEPVLISGALIKVWERLDPNHDTMKHSRAYTEGLKRIKRDSNSEPGNSQVLASHRFIHSKAQGVYGPSWPANFDVSP